MLKLLMRIAVRRCRETGNGWAMTIWKASLLRSEIWVRLALVAKMRRVSSRFSMRKPWNWVEPWSGRWIRMTTLVYSVVRVSFQWHEGFVNWSLQRIRYRNKIFSVRPKRIGFQQNRKSVLFPFNTSPHLHQGPWQPRRKRTFPVETLKIDVLCSS